MNTEDITPIFIKKSSTVALLGISILSALSLQSMENSEDSFIPQITPPLSIRMKQKFEQAVESKDCKKCLLGTCGGGTACVGFSAPVASYATCPLWTTGTGLKGWLLCNGVLAGNAACCAVGILGTILLGTACECKDCPPQ